jgi:hypothetical protein
MREVLKERHPAGKDRHSQHRGRDMRAIMRAARLVALVLLLAAAGVALGFLAALVRPRPRSRYASLGQPVAPDGPRAGGGA